MAAYAWGVSRIIDALELLPESAINPDRIGVTGCSSVNGAGALYAGAFEPRIKLTTPIESGPGGFTSWRILAE
jgi:cephalosporin-C deacetylase-like acetyl esterase